VRRALASGALFLFVWLLSTPGAATPPAKGLDALLERCARSPGLSAQFTEEKQIALLAVPLRSEGVLHFAPGRGLVRHTSKPSPQSVLVTDQDLVFWDGKTTKRIALGSSVTIETFAHAFSLLLTANRAALEKSFSLVFRADDAGDGWSLRLSPTGADLKKVIASIEIEGRGLDLSLLRVRETNGDVSTTRFSAVDAARKYTDAELDRLFRVPPPS
jgi:Outer membrane lipoprotein carrier protein LolA-like